MEESTAHSEVKITRSHIKAWQERGSEYWFLNSLLAFLPAVFGKYEPISSSQSPVEIRTSAPIGGGSNILHQAGLQGRSQVGIKPKGCVWSERLAQGPSPAAFLPSGNSLGMSQPRKRNGAKRDHAQVLKRARAVAWGVAALQAPLGSEGSHAFKLCDLVSHTSATCPEAKLSCLGKEWSRCRVVTKLRTRRTYMRKDVLRCKC